MPDFEWVDIVMFVFFWLAGVGTGYLFWGGVR